MAPPDNFDDDASPLPCVGGLVAGTLALMTTWAAPHPNAAADVAQQRDLLARKIVSNLFFLQNHPAVGAPLQQVLRNVHARWVSIQQQSAHPAVPPAPTPPAAHAAARLH